MEFETMKSKVYILVDDENRITRIDGGYSLQNVDVDTWIYIDEGEGDKYNLCQGHYLEKPLMTDDFIYRYKYISNEIVERTEDEIEADRREREEQTPEPTQLDRIEAQTMYTALMTDTLIEEV